MKTLFQWNYPSHSLLLSPILFLSAWMLPSPSCLAGHAETRALTALELMCVTGDLMPLGKAEKQNCTCFSLNEGHASQSCFSAYLSQSSEELCGFET